jgi:hypothetical protein
LILVQRFAVRKILRKAERFAPPTSTVTEIKIEAMFCVSLFLFASHYAAANNDMSPFSPQLVPPRIDSPFPADVMNAVMSKSGLPVLGKPIPPSILEKLPIVKSESMTPSAADGGFFAYSWRDDVSCSPNKPIVNVFGYRAEKCFGLDIYYDDSLGYGSYSFNCDESKFELNLLK